MTDESLFRGTLAREIHVREEADLSAAFKDGEAVTVYGGGTGLSGAAVPVRGGILLRMAAYSGVTAFIRKDGYYEMEVLAGTTLQDVRTMLRTRRIPPGKLSEHDRKIAEDFASDRMFCFLPDPTEELATLGGMLATNAYGPQGNVYGKTGAHVSSLRWVGTDGQCRAGGEEAVRSFAGSEGMYGIIDRMTIRLHPAPAEEWTVVLFFRDETASLQLAQELSDATDAEDKDGRLTALDWADNATLSALRSCLSGTDAVKGIGTIPADACAALYLILTGEDASCVEERLMTVLDAFERAGGREEDTFAASDAQGRARLRTFRHGLTLGIAEAVRAKVNAATPGHHLAFSLSSEQKALSVFVREIREVMSRYKGVPYTLSAHCIGHEVQISFLPGGGENPCHTAVATEIAASLTAVADAVSGAYGIGKTKRDWFLSHAPAGCVEAVRMLKGKYDPEGKMNPDNMI